MSLPVPARESNLWLWQTPSHPPCKTWILFSVASSNNNNENIRIFPTNQTRENGTEGGTKAAQKRTTASYIVATRCQYRWAMSNFNAPKTIELRPNLFADVWEPKHMTINEKWFEEINKHEPKAKITKTVLFSEQLQKRKQCRLYSPHMVTPRVKWK